ncbi:M48 family metallopeptidase [Aurantivibrio plasticivorans]
MNFFQHQDTAKRNTLLLVGGLGLAIIGLILLTTAVFVVLIYYFQFRSDTAIVAFEQNASIFSIAQQILSVELLAYITFGVGSVVALGSLYKIAQLSGGGKKVAEAMGGRLLNINTRDADERKVLNVVEEMAIASGTPVPPVYLLEEDAINAFAAGFKPQDAVIGVTRGCIQLLSRDELQGVIAHEFSHVLHGDMRLNIRLVGLLHGILVIGLIGYFLMRSTAYSSMRSSRNKGAGGLMFVGLALIVLGYAGTFFGNIIKAAVSRQREYLADASAVQFTRNPQGIAGALKKIGGYSAGSQLHSAHASEFSHMLFGQGIKTGFNALMATHPPLSDRIKRIEPNWPGRFPRVEIDQSHTSNAATSQFAGETTPQTTTLQTDTPAINPSALESIGQPSEAHFDYARDLLNSIPEDLHAATHDPYSARAIVYCLLLDKSDMLMMQQQLSEISQHADRDVFKLIRHMAESIGRLSKEHWLPLLDLCLPALKQLSDAQYKTFKENLVRLIRSDKKVDLFEWSLYRIVTHNVEEVSRKTGSKAIHQMDEEIRILLSLVAQAGHDSKETADAAFSSAMQELSFGKRTMMSKDFIKLSYLDRVLGDLSQLKPLHKPLLLKALAACISHDKSVTATEAELFRAIADSLDCPIPPILEGQRLA